MHLGRRRENNGVSAPDPLAKLAAPMQDAVFFRHLRGRILVAANQNAMTVREGQQARAIPAGLAVFRIRADGKLDFVRKYDVVTDGERNLFWMGLVSLP